MVPAPRAARSRHRADGQLRPGSECDGRDGLIIALLISCPMRLKNLASLVIGQHLVFDVHDYQVKLAAAETKTGRPYVAAVPHELTPYIERWLQVYRRVPLTAAASPATENIERHLWINRSGKPMSSRAIHEQIKKRTREAFAKGIWPHLFRDCAVPNWSIPPRRRSASRPTSWATPTCRPTRKHYIKRRA